MRFLLSLLFSSLLAFVFPQTVNRVRLFDHTSYIEELVQRTIDYSQKNNWYNLNVHDVTIQIDEEVLNKTVQGTVTFENGFVVSIQHIDLIPHTIQQVWLYSSSTNITALSLQSTMRMNDVTIGYDVNGMMDGEKYHNTGTMLYPLIQFQISLIKNLYTDELSSQVVPVLVRTINEMNFFPQDELTQVLSHLYDWNSTFPSVESWANVFAPIVLDLALTEHPIPPYCYDC